MADKANKPVTTGQDARAMVAAQLISNIEPDNKVDMSEDERIAWYITRFYEVYHALGNPPGFTPTPPRMIVGD